MISIKCQIFRWGQSLLGIAWCHVNWNVTKGWQTLSCSSRRLAGQLQNTTLSKQPYTKKSVAVKSRDLAGKATSPNLKDNVICKQILQYCHADVHQVCHYCILLKLRAISYLQSCLLTTQEWALHFQIPLSTDSCLGSSVICEKVQPKNTLHSNTASYHDLLFVQWFFTKPRGLEKDQYQQFCLFTPTQSWQLASSLIMKWSMKVASTTFNSSS
jgi:hypothetical protein